MIYLLHLIRYAKNTAYKISLVLTFFAISFAAFSQQYAKDLSFTTTTGIDQFLQVCEALPNGDMLIAGAFSIYNGQAMGGIGKIHEDGSADVNFNASGTGANGAVNDFVIQPDGKIIIVGTFTSYNGVARNRIARLNSDGTLDLSFDPQQGFSFWCHTIELQSDGKMVVGGVFDTFNGNSSSSLARLNSDGSFDSSFNSGVPANHNVFDLHILTGGQILIAGDFTTYSGLNQKYLVRLNSDGTYDTSFNTGNTGASGAILGMDLLTNGNILIWGNFTSYNGTSSKFISGLNPDGTLANPFAFSDLAFSCSSICTLSNGQLLAAGHSTSYNGTPIYQIVRYNSDGSVDPTSGMITANETITSMTLLPNEKVLVGGQFTQFKGQSQPRITRMSPCVPTYATDTQTACNSFTWINGVNYTSSNNTATHTLVNANGCDSVVTLDLTIVNTYDTLNVTACDSYFWPATNQTYTTSGQHSGIISNPSGCDSLVTLLLTVNYSSNTTLTQQACNSFTWPINGQTYIQSGLYSVNYLTSNGCDSIITLDLSISHLNVNAFTFPSSLDSCNGAVYLSASENPDFTFAINGMPDQTTSGTALFEGFCPGIYTVLTTDGLGDTLNSLFIVPSDSNCYFNNPLVGNVLDSLAELLETCNIDFTDIDTAYIGSIVFGVVDTVIVNWFIVVNQDTVIFSIPYLVTAQGGMYYLQLQIYCPQKSTPQYFVVTEGVLLENSTAGLQEEISSEIHIFPNPVRNQVTILFDDEYANLTVTDLNGKLLSATEIGSGETISIGEYPAGIYIFKINTINNTVVKRVVKE